MSDNLQSNVIYHGQIVEIAWVPKMHFAQWHTEGQKSRGNISLQADQCMTKILQLVTAVMNEHSFFQIINFWAPYLTTGSIFSECEMSCASLHQ
jgi:hypothetical protein